MGVDVPTGQRPGAIEQLSPYVSAGTTVLYGNRPKSVNNRSLGAGSAESAAHAEAVDQRAVPLHVDLRQVLTKTTTPADKQQQPPPRVVVVLVHLEVLGEVVDAFGEQCDLRLRRTGVGVMQAVLSPGFLSSVRQ